MRARAGHSECKIAHAATQCCVPQKTQVKQTTDEGEEERGGEEGRRQEGRREAEVNRRALFKTRTQHRSVGKNTTSDVWDGARGQMNLTAPFACQGKRARCFLRDPRPRIALRGRARRESARQSRRTSQRGAETGEEAGGEGGGGSGRSSSRSAALQPAFDASSVVPCRSAASACSSARRLLSLRSPASSFLDSASSFASSLFSSLPASITSFIPSHSAT